jgi:hypothetical protein
MIAFIIVIGFIVFALIVIGSVIYSAVVNSMEK